MATLGRLVPQLRRQELPEDERETVRRQIGRVFAPRRTGSKNALGNDGSPRRSS
ncbi:DUF6192 family protein [Streptomyces sp. NPDC002701]|uniref:DUF6192 family protein n=1 Tax=Streptomyces sp. NPDC002701 TaxID=3364661 RepID=UPI003695AD22